MLDSEQLADLLRTLALSAFRVEPGPAHAALRAGAETAAWGALMPDTRHAGQSVGCRLVAVEATGLLLLASISSTAVAVGWQPAVAVIPLGQQVLRFLVRDLRLAPDAQGMAGASDRAGGTLLACAYPPAVWQVPRREVFRATPPAKTPMYLHGHGPAGPWQGRLLDLGIGGLAVELRSAAPPCGVDAVLPACTLSDGHYTSPAFNLRVRSVAALGPSGRWRLGAALLDPSREVVSSLQLATYRFETEPRRQRLAAEARCNSAVNAVNAPRRPADRR